MKGHHLIQNSQQEPAPNREIAPWVEADGSLRQIPDEEWLGYTPELRADWYRMCGKQALEEWSNGFRNPGYREDPTGMRGLP